mmetsp:Transcript_38158/g.110171  ORF Transcript_38158/g.110171 Transcript_38158/m.110171 type:complete len:247 (-) Transcript_38158:20-760(-)
MPFLRLKRDLRCVDLSPSPKRVTSTSQDAAPDKGAAKRAKANEPRQSAAATAVEACGDRSPDAPPAATEAGAAAQVAVSAELSEAAKKRARARELVCEKLVEALGDPQLVENIEHALNEQLGDGKEYSAQARTLLFNLKATGEGSLRQKLLEGRCRPEQLPKMSADEMLSDAKVSERADAQRRAAEASTVKAGAQEETDMFTCESCSGNRTAFTRTSELRSYGAEQKMVSVSHVTCLTCGNAWITR